MFCDLLIDIVLPLYLLLERMLFFRHQNSWSPSFVALNKVLPVGPTNRSIFKGGLTSPLLTTLPWLVTGGAWLPKIFGPVWRSSSIGDFVTRWTLVVDSLSVHTASVFLLSYRLFLFFVLCFIKKCYWEIYVSSTYQICTQKNINTYNKHFKFIILTQEICMHLNIKCPFDILSMDLSMDLSMTCPFKKTILLPWKTIIVCFSCIISRKLR